jgi:hypothetical protein
MELVIAYFEALSRDMSSENVEIGNNRIQDDPPTI